MFELFLKDEFLPIYIHDSYTNMFRSSILEPPSVNGKKNTDIPGRNSSRRSRQSKLAPTGSQGISVEMVGKKKGI